MNHKRSKGFSLLEVILALVVVTSAGLGVYALFDSGIKSNNISDATNQVVEIANVYTDLASSNLTNNVESDGIVSLLQKSGRLPSKYFTSNGAEISNAFGELVFSSDPKPTPYSFEVAIPLGCLPANSTIPKQLFNKVQDVYSCDSDGEKDFDTCAQDTSCSGAGSESMLTLYFNLNN